MGKEVWKGVLVIEGVDLPWVGYTQVRMVLDECSEWILEKREGGVIENRF
ncbi:hypothetical protein [Bacillus altitudinis]|nr:hypothetical protein [Bacillus altitudinis]